MYKLYYMAGACSTAVHVVLNELGQKVELLDVKDAAIKDSQEFAQDNPRKQVPMLIDGNFKIREGAAILMHLIDKHNSLLLPRSGNERTNALEWLMFANATMHPTYSRAFFAMRNISDKVAQEEVLKLTKERILLLWREVDLQLSKTKYVCGNDITAADILLAVIANWNVGVKIEGENLLRMLKDVSSRPAFKTALEREGASYKAV